MLIDDLHPDGKINPAFVTAHATCHGDTLSINGQRLPTAAATARIAATASAKAVPVAAGTCGSGSRAASTTVNQERTDSAAPAKARSQPRTVSTGRPNWAAIDRNPAPEALASKAAPITTATSARRNKAITGNNTWVARQTGHHARRGRILTRERP